jgi:hypothetical protein
MAQAATDDRIRRAESGEWGYTKGVENFSALQQQKIFLVQGVLQQED